MRVFTFCGLAFIIAVMSVNGLGWLLPQWGNGGLGQQAITFAVTTALIALSYMVTFHRRN